MTSNFAECGGFLKTRPDLDVPDIQLHFGMAMADDHGRKRHRGTGFSMHVCQLRPKSRGSVALGSADPFAPPLIDPNFLGEAEDLETMVAGFKVTRRLLETPALRALQQKDMFTEDIETDDQIRELLRQRVDTVYHPVGTARMGSDAMAVVDAKLKVHGLEGLRVVDASVMPTLIGGNTNAPTIMIGEKASDMIKAETAGVVDGPEAYQRHCEEPLRRSNPAFLLRHGLLRFARNDVERASPRLVPAISTLRQAGDLSAAMMLATRSRNGPQKTSDITGAKQWILESKAAAPSSAHRARVWAAPAPWRWPTKACMSP